jgi:hypothetical protein
MRLFLVFLLAGCSTLSYRSPGPYEGGRLLGNGTYFAEIWLAPPGQGESRFNGLVSKQPSGWLFNAVAPSGKAAYRVREGDDGPRAEYRETELSIPKSAFDEFYASLRELLLLYDKPTAQEVVERHGDGRPRKLSRGLVIDEYDWNGHAFRITLNHGGVGARVTLREYSP